ncbi:MAG: primosomal protein N' [Alphaproteobacteria bacterium]|nr:primosomal protein N' [Alphaproteobacteria bacterium]
MFDKGQIVKVLIPNVINTGYDYRLTESAEIGDFVHCTVMNQHYIGVIIGLGDSKLDSSKIKSVISVYKFSSLSKEDIDWIYKMSDWTLMTPGAVLRLILNVPDAFNDPKTEMLYSVDTDLKFKMTETRQLVIDAFNSNGNDLMSINDIRNISHVSLAVIKSMIKSNILKIEKSRIKPEHNRFVYEYTDACPVQLNTEQQKAADSIAESLNDKFVVHLLDGVTGSGKTQVYFDSILRVYNTGKSVLVMMPEIALTAQFISRFEKRFGAPPVVWHSNLTAARRRDIWRGVAEGKIRIVIGTRSALFLPWQKLGLIIVDEEHDTSYKQEDMGNYHARDMAVLRAKISNIPVVLASATPSMETLHNVFLGKYNWLRLTSRFGGAQLPSIETIDMRKNKIDTYVMPGSDKPIDGCLSNVLCNKIKDTLDKHQQTMLFINRRGFAPIIQCNKCGWISECLDCSVGLTYHKHIGKLMCHMCGKTQPLPKVCPKCGHEVTMRGIGIEKIQQEISFKFPTARTALVSSDTILSRESLERLVSQMEQGQIDIIIGTQILAKGHHFPNLTLVGVVDADMGLFGTDFRAPEHTFQQLFQVAGRAGRGECLGKVLLQTYQPDNPVIKAICANDRDSFINQDMEARRVAKMPPFGQLIAVIVEAPKEQLLKNYCKKLSDVTPIIQGGKIMGPIVAQIYQIRNWYRMRFLVVAEKNIKLQPVVREWINKIKQPANIRIKIDVNPQSFS